MKLTDLCWEPGYHHQYGVRYEEADITELLNLPDEVLAVTIRKYPYRYTIAAEFWAGEEYGRDGDADWLAPCSLIRIVAKIPYRNTEVTWADIKEQAEHCVRRVLDFGL